MSNLSLYFSPESFVSARIAFGILPHLHFYVYIYIYLYIYYIYIHIYIPVIHLYPELWSIEIRIDFGILLYVFHLVLLLAAGRLFQLQQAELLVASSANIGGPATANAFVDVPKHGEFMVKTMENPWKTRGKTRKPKWVVYGIVIHGDGMGCKNRIVGDRAKI